MWRIDGSVGFLPVDIASLSTRSAVHRNLNVWTQILLADFSPLDVRSAAFSVVTAAHSDMKY